ncbi:Acyltransferase [Mucilaginibacter mallensis]|uniref:Acyltransferase n=1 Tax=Mucilaginibacter mallensis TaxID=652787 RepID=A0A1H1MF17_MUCMA|nr:1-acyl-sn-glycerol-3-phosphate acyltransferase [Mucilaginibacter mallensis]SDR85431.1 Acyltransferase [Mucilaginibacter mallensis]
MIYPKKNPVIFWTMHYYVKWIVGRHFHELLFNRIETDKSRSILLIVNHYSFWDSLILYCVNTRLFKKKMYIMILEETARGNAFFKYAGAFSINKKSKDMLLSLDYAANLLNDPQNMVVIFPQGRLYSNFVDHIIFEKGVLRIIKQAQGSFQLVFAAAFVQYFKHKKPTATVYLKTADESFADTTINELQSAYQQYYDRSKQLQTEIDIEQ